MSFIINLANKLRGSLNKVDDYRFINELKSGESIPKVVHQTYHKKILPPEIQQNIAHLKSANPEWEFRLYDDNDIENYIQTHYPQIISIYKKINPIYGAARADFFRYLLMYNEGGVYLDIKSGLNKPLKNIISANEQFIVCYWNLANKVTHDVISNPNGEIQQWHIATVKGHPFLKSVIENVCNNIKHYNPLLHDTGHWGVLNLTGPIAYTAAITPFLSTHACRICYDHDDVGFTYSIYQSNVNANNAFVAHHKAYDKKHYTKCEESIVIQGFSQNLVFMMFQPLRKLAKNYLSKKKINLKNTIK